jgi:hypothetical protein
MRRYLFLVFSICYISVLTAQKQDFISIAFQYHPTDFFGNLGWKRERSSYAFGANFGVGINRTFFQQRFYPKLTGCYGRDWIPAKKVQFSTELRMSFSYLNVQKNAYHGGTKQSELLFYSQLGYGENRRISVGIGVGPSFEWIGENHSFFRSWLYLMELNYAFAKHRQ